MLADETPELARLRHFVCERKNTFDFDGARRHARWQNRYGKPSRDGQTLTPYQCPFCHHWHCGRPPSMRTVAKIAKAIRGLL